MQLLHLLLVALATFFRCSSAENFTLELLQVLFRHGDRVPEKMEIYKTDPYDSFYREQGYGQLIKHGRYRMYRTGWNLFNRYNYFLNFPLLGKNDERYREMMDGINAYTTDTHCTKASLELVLIAMFWPNFVMQRWTPSYSYEKQNVGFMTAHYSTCESLMRRVTRDADQQLESTVGREFLEYIGEKTAGFNSTAALMTLLYSNLEAATQSFDLPLPDWCSPADYDRLKKVAEMFFASLTGTQFKAKVFAGRLLEKFLSNVEEHERNHTTKKKIYLYSAHDIQVAPFLNAHNFTDDLIPKLVEYGSAVVIEKWRGVTDKQVYLSMSLWLGVRRLWIDLKLKDCDYKCPLSNYTRIMSWAMPDEGSDVCGEVDYQLKKQIL